MGNAGRLSCLAVRASRQEDGQYERHGACGRNRAKDGPLCAQHRDKLAAHSDWPLQQRADRKALLAALAAHMNEIVPKARRETPVKAASAQPKSSPVSSDSALDELLKKSAIPAAIAVFFGGFALLLEQIYLSAFDIDLNVLGSQTDAASIIVRNSGYLVAAITALLGLSALLVMVFLLLVVATTLIAERTAPEVNRVRSWSHYLALRAWGALRWVASQIAGSAAGKKLGMRPATVRPVSFDPEARRRELDRTSNERWMRAQAAVRKFAGQAWQLLFTGNRNRNWVRALSVSTPLAGLLVVLLVFSNSSRIVQCVEEYRVKATTGEFCGDRAFWPVRKPFTRRPQIATVLLKNDFAGVTALNVAYCQPEADSPAERQNNCAQGRLLNGSYSEPMLHIGNYGDFSLFFDMRPGGRAVSIPKADIKAISFGRLSPEQKPVSFAQSVSSMLVWLRSNFPTPERPAIIVVDGGQKVVAEAFATLNRSVDNVAARIGGTVSVAKLGSNRDTRQGWQVAALEMGNADAGGSVASSSQEASATVIAALDKASVKLAGMADIAAALGHETGGAPSGLMRRLDELNKAVNELPALVIPPPLVTVNAPAIKVENIVEPAAVTVVNKVEPPSVNIENKVESASVLIKNEVVPAPIKEVTVRLTGLPPVFASAGLPDEWIGAAKAIREICDESSISWIGAPIEFDHASTSPRDSEWLARLLAGVSAKMKEYGNGSGLIVIAGSADSTGSPMTNLEFAERRASFVHRAMELAIGRDQNLQQVIKLGSAWNIASYGVGEQFTRTGGVAEGTDGAAKSPRYVRVGLCRPLADPASK